MNLALAFADKHLKAGSERGRPRSEGKRHPADVGNPRLTRRLRGVPATDLSDECGLNTDKSSDGR